jgi:hypothetical protein
MGFRIRMYTGGGKGFLKRATFHVAASLRDADPQAGAPRVSERLGYVQSAWLAAVARGTVPLLLTGHRNRGQSPPDRDWILGQRVWYNYVH